MIEPVVLMGSRLAAAVGIVGGKARGLAGLSGIPDVRVPPFFCVSTIAFRRVREGIPGFSEVLGRAEHLKPGDAGLASYAAEIRAGFEAARIPDDIVAAIEVGLASLPADSGYAVRSSAVDEDLASASFAGQHASFLQVSDLAGVLGSLRRCWASLFSDSALAYRLERGLSLGGAEMAVIVQQMVPADASGVLFTACPLSGNRTVSTIEATPGLGDSLVSGLVAPESYTLSGGRITSAPDGASRCLSDAQALVLDRLARSVAAHFAVPQDIEWCLADDQFFLVQARPITTLFPPPASAAPDGGVHVYLSVGHQQMMTDAMRPLGLSLWQLTARMPMAEAGGRLFVDVTRALGSAAARPGLLAGLERSDPLTRDALDTLLARDGLFPETTGSAPSNPFSNPPEPIEADPALVASLIARHDAGIAAAAARLQHLCGTEVFDAIREDLEALRTLLFDPQSMQVIMAAVESTWWLREHLRSWLDDPAAADALTQSAPGNVSAEMGFALQALAARIAGSPAASRFLRSPDAALQPEALVQHAPDIAQAVAAFLERYGARCPGEIDITRPRWGEQPNLLLPLLLAHLESPPAPDRFEQGKAIATRTERAVLARLKALPDGTTKAALAKRMIDRLRTFVGFREYPKYAWMRRFFHYKQALLGEARRLTERGVLRTPEDCFFLRFEEFEAAARTGQVDLELLDARRREHAHHERLTPPRVITSDGEGLNGRYRRDPLPDGALAGLAVSAGIVEGRARVVLDPSHASIAPGEILVTPHTDPSWSPLFLTAAGLITEVGGLMTHGAVVAREYGLPAVVGVAHATQRITDGQWIRLNGTDGVVEILDVGTADANA